VPVLPAPERHWVPDVGASWQYQLQGDVDTSVTAGMGFRSIRKHGT
jgi:hypothetical protein